MAGTGAGGLPLTMALNYTVQLCCAGYLHTQIRVIFRDLKPGNVMVTDSGEIKLIDFGIARFFKPGQTHNTINLGTPGYASPEHGGQGQTNPRSDVYSLGVMLHQMVTGYDPTATPFALPPACSLNPAVPLALEAAIQKAIQLRPDDRFQTVAVFKQALQPASQPIASPGGTQVLPGSGNDPGGLSSVHRGYDRKWLLIAGLVAVAVIGITLAGNQLSPPAETPTPAPPASSQQQPPANKMPSGAGAPISTEPPAPTPVTPSPTAPSNAGNVPAGQTNSPAPARIHSFLSCAQPCTENGSNATRTFPAGAIRLYAQWKYENIPSGAHYVREWAMNGQTWIKYDCTWPGPASGIDEVTLKEPGGLHSGTWEVTIAVDGNVLLRERVMVEGNSTYWSPAGTFNSCYGNYSLPCCLNTKPTVTHPKSICPGRC
jgi:serine/threonine protein kinase